MGKDKATDLPSFGPIDFTHHVPSTNSSQTTYLFIYYLVETSSSRIIRKNFLTQTSKQDGRHF